MLRVEVISQLAPRNGDDRLLGEWSELAEACAYSTIFQTPQWLATWWDVFGTGARGRKLHILAVRDGDRLAGLIPLMQSGWRGLPIRRLSFLGHGVTDYSDAIAAPGREDEVCDAVYAYLAKQADWAVLDFRELREGGLLRERPPAPSTRLSYSDWPLEPCPYLSLPTEGTTEERWTKLLGGYSKKMRSNIGYYDRTLKRAFQVEDRVVASAEELPDAFESLYELHRRRWNRRWLPGVFGSSKVRSFHLQAGKKLLERGWLRLHLLLLDDEVQAALYAFAFRDRTCYYQGGFEPELSRFSLGTVLIANAIRRAMVEEFPTFDFLRGNEEYKQRWTNGVHRMNIRRLIARAGSPQLAVAERVHRLEAQVETRGKALFAGGIVNRAPQQQPHSQGRE